MTRNVLGDAADLLARHYGPLPESGPPGEWITLVRVILERGRAVKNGRDWSWVEETPLRTPSETAVQSASRLAEILEAAGHSATKAIALSGCAGWWLREIGDRGAVAAFRQRPLETWERDLRGIRGVSWELADRILLVVGGLAVFPLDRGSMRIAARHGWMGIEDDYDDWQAFFVGGLCDTEVDLRQLAQWTGQLGRDFCGPKPKCEQCPLKGLLPANGPVPLET
jgi:endonuclease-3 related protein